MYRVCVPVVSVSLYMVCSQTDEAWPASTTPLCLKKAADQFPIIPSSGSSDKSTGSVCGWRVTILLAVDDNGIPWVFGLSTSVARRRFYLRLEGFMSSCLDFRVVKGLTWWIVYPSSVLNVHGFLYKGIKYWSYVNDNIFCLTTSQWLYIFIYHI